MRYKCIAVDQHELWFTEGKIYDGEEVISPTAFSGGKYLLIKKADDGFPAYALKIQFQAQVEPQITSV